jgi:four helix bundle protein
MSRMHHELRAWQDAMSLVNAVYRFTERFPENERFGLAIQMRRAAVSVPSNIAEGAARGSRKEFGRFLQISRGSLSELDTQVRVASNLGYCNGEALLAQIDALFGVLGSLIKSQARTRSLTPHSSQAAQRPTSRS